VDHSGIQKANPQSDEWVEGCFVPKGSIIFLNVWGLHHDEKRYPDHDIFNPDNFKGQTALATEYANAADPEARDHYGYGSLFSNRANLLQYISDNLSR